MNILVVEDEYYSKKSLVKILNELNFDFEKILEADNGKKAIGYLEEINIDLVITDIRMPEMDGISLAKYISENFPKTNTIIVSGYSDFNYAKEAIQYGVKNYLLKPISVNELIESIEALLGSIKQKEKELENHIKNHSMQESIKYVSIPIIMNSKTLLMDFQKLCGNKFDDMQYKLFLFQSNTDTDISSFFCFLKEHFENNNMYIFHFVINNEIVLLLFSVSEEELNQNNMSEIEHKLIEKDIACGCSRIYNKLMDLEKAYKDGIYAINRRLLDKSCPLYEYEIESNVQQILTEQTELLLYEHISKSNYEQAIAIVKDFLYQCETEAKCVYSLYSGIMQIFSIVSKCFCNRETTEDFDKKNRYLLFSFKSDLYQFKSIMALEEYIAKIIKNICEDQDINNENIIIDDVKKYVSINYRYEIVLKELASHKYFLNSSYLSRLFKQETGMNFSKYLTKYRMNKASELLINTSFKINEISDFVGYNDTSYFIQIFRKEFNLTPEQYRLEEESKKSYI